MEQVIWLKAKPIFGYFHVVHRPYCDYDCLTKKKKEEESMHFTCPCMDLTKAVDVVQRAIAKVQNTIQDCILFECREDSLILRATDKTLAMSTELNARVQEDGVAAVPARILGEILRKLPAGELTMKVSTPQTAELHCDASRIDIQLQNPNEFPSFPVVESNQSMIISQAKLRSMIDQVIFAVATGDDKPILTGVLFELSKDRLTLAAVDGFRMAVREDEAQGDVSGHFVAPARAIREVARCMSDTDLKVEISFDRARVCFRVGPTEILTQLLEGEYVPYRTLFPKSSAIHMRIDRSALLHTVERAIILSDTTRNNGVTFDITENAVIVRSQSTQGSLEEAIPVITQGDDLKIVLNGRYVMDVLKAIEDQEVTFMFNSNIAPCAVEKNGMQSYGYLILPIQVG